MIHKRPRPSCFVVMPFDVRADVVLQDAILPAAESAGYDCQRADDVMKPGAVMKDVVAGIFDADAVVADLTGSNPNVFYEVGIAHTIVDHTVMICEEGESLPFDLAGDRTITYTQTPEGLRALRTRLAECLRQLRTSLGPSNPVRQYAPTSLQVSFSRSSPHEALSELFMVDGRFAFLPSNPRQTPTGIRPSDSFITNGLSPFVEEQSDDYSTDVDIADPVEHMLVVGSPRYNPVAEQIQRYFDLPYEFVFARAEASPIGRALRIVTLHGDELEASRDNCSERNGAGTEYGVLLVARLKNRKQLVWLAGIHATGTLGVYRYLLDNARHVLAEFRRLPTTGPMAVSWLIRASYEQRKHETGLDGLTVESLGRQAISAPKTARTKPRALLVDLGDVVMSFDRTRTYRAIAHLANEDYVAVKEKIERTDFRSQYERGKINDEEFCGLLLNLFAEDVRRGLQPMLPEFWGDIFWPNNEVISALRHLKDMGVTLVLVSDTNPLHFDHVKKDYPDIVGLFEHRILSYELGVTKPNPLVFKGAIDWVSAERGIGVAEMLYVDDQEDSVREAERHGVRGFVYRSYPHFVFWLRKEGLYVP